MYSLEKFDKIMTKAIFCYSALLHFAPYLVAIYLLTVVFQAAIFGFKSYFANFSV